MIATLGLMRPTTSVAACALAVQLSCLNQKQHILFVSHFLMKSFRTSVIVTMHECQSLFGLDPPSAVLASSSFLACNSRLRSAIRRHHPPQRAVLSQICCFGERKWCCFRSCWTVLSHMMRGRPSCLLQSARGAANRILLACALSSMHIICPNRVSQRDWIIAVSLGCFVTLRTSSFRTNWYYLMPSSIRRHHWSSASILRASFLDIAQQSEPCRNIGKIHVLYSFNLVEMASRDLQS